MQVSHPDPLRRALGLLPLAALWPRRAAAEVPPATPPALLLASDWTPGRSPAGFLVSEKLDGVRAVWDGRHLRLRGGGTVAAPPPWLQGLPREALDGELWLGHGRFDEVSALVRRERPEPADWATLQYCVFELPGAPGPFAARAQRLQDLCARARHPGLLAEPQRSVRDAAALDAWLQAVVAGGGEGLMLHRADSPFHTGRSQALLKYKPLHDAEALVLAHVPGRGRLAGLMGALRVRTPEGREFLLGTGFTDAQRRDPPPVGSWVTYQYRGLTSGGLPRFASFLRARDDGL